MRQSMGCDCHRSGSERTERSHCQLREHLNPGSSSGWMSEAGVRVLERGTRYGKKGAFVVKRFSSNQRDYYRHLDEKWEQPTRAELGPVRFGGDCRVQFRYDARALRPVDLLPVGSPDRDGRVDPRVKVAGKLRPLSQVIAVAFGLCTWDVLAETELTNEGKLVPRWQAPKRLGRVRSRGWGSG